MHNYRYVIYTLVSISLSVYGEESSFSSISIENLKKDQISYGLVMNYTNIETNATKLIDTPIVVDGRVIFVPVIGSANIDALTVSPSISYGLSKDTSITGTIDYVKNNRRTLNPKQDETDSYVNSAFFSIERNLCSDLEQINNELCNNGFHLMGNVGISIAQARNLDGKNNVKFDFGKNFNLGLSLQKKIDPLILGLAINYGLTSERKINDVNYNPPDIISISPSVVFLVNERISLNSSFGWIRKDISKINGSESDNEIVKTQTNLRFGLDWKLTKNLNFETGVSSKISGNSQAQITLGFRYTQ
jgi:long-subunit fatty acid transport protein